MGMVETLSDSRFFDAVNDVLNLQDEYTEARPSQSMLEDIPEDCLPTEYRDKIRLRMTSSDFYVAFNDNPELLEPDEDGFIPHAYLKKVSVMVGPRRLGSVIRGWVDQIRDTEGDTNN